jgi:hypothetical protein
MGNQIVTIILANNLSSEGLSIFPINVVIIGFV